MSARRLRTIVSIGACVVGLVVAEQVIGGGGGSSQPSNVQSAPVALNPVDPASAPIGSDAETTTLSRAQDAAPFEVLDPSTKLASHETVNKIWGRYDTDPAVAIEYQSGIQILESPAPAIDFPTDYFYKQLSADLPGASVTLINDAPATVIQTVESQGNPASIDVILDGVRVTILGLKGQSVDDLTTGC